MKKSVENMVELAYKVHYRRYFSRYLKKTMKEPIRDIPPEVSKEAVEKVWGKYCHVDPKWAQYYYTMNGIASPEYVSSEVWFGKICRRLNQKARYPLNMFHDKNYLDVFFGDEVRCPEVLVRNINGQMLDKDFSPIGEDRACELAAGMREVVIKPSVETKGGKAVSFITNTGDDEAYIEEVRSAIRGIGPDFVMQGPLVQHSHMAELNPDSINTIRVLSLLWKGEVIILGALVRIGTKGIRVDNPHTSNGFSCVLTKEGRLIRTAYDRNWYPHEVLPNGLAVEGFEVPHFDALIDAVKKMHFKVPHARIMGWDMTVSEAGEPQLIEANMDNPEVYFHQLGAGPIFAGTGLLDEIMTYVTS